MSRHSPRLFAFDLADQEEAREVAQQIAGKRGKVVVVTDEHGNEILQAHPTARTIRLSRMRTVGQYLAEAAKFDDLANTAPDPALKQRYADLAECYRMLARERERLIAEGVKLPA